MSAAAVVSAPIVYVEVVAVTKLLVGFLFKTIDAPSDLALCLLLVVASQHEVRQVNPPNLSM